MYIINRFKRMIIYLKRTYSDYTRKMFFSLLINVYSLFIYLFS